LDRCAGCARVWLTTARSAHSCCPAPCLSRCPPWPVRRPIAAPAGAVCLRPAARGRRRMPRHADATTRCPHRSATMWSRVSWSGLVRQVLHASASEPGGAARRLRGPAHGAGVPR
jgi:hypothetical protein